MRRSEAPIPRPTRHDAPLAPKAPAQAYEKSANLTKALLRAAVFGPIAVLALLCSPAPPVFADLRYEAQIVGVDDSDLADLLDEVSQLKTLEDRLPGSEEALRRRAVDRLRGRLGLTRLVFGSAPPGTASSNLTPAAGGNAATSPAISGGKYVAKGVYVGATQGLTPQSSKVTVEIEVRPHVTVETDLSQTAGTGIGLNYKYDY